MFAKVLIGLSRFAPEALDTPVLGLVMSTCSNEYFEGNSMLRTLLFSIRISFRGCNSFGYIIADQLLAFALELAR